MAFFFPELHPQIDWRKPPRFRDKELTGITFGATPDNMVADKLVELRLAAGRTQWVLVHIEVQAQRDPELARRVLDYNYRIFNEYRQPVASLVLLADEDPDWRPGAFHNDVLGTVMGISFATAKLLDHAEQDAALLASDNPFAWVVLAHLRTQQARHDPNQLYAVKSQLTRLMFQHGWHKERILAMFKVINWMMVLPAPLQQRYWDAVIELDMEVDMTRLSELMEIVTPLEQMFMDRGWEKGLKEGRAAGLEAGREEGREEGLEAGRREGALALLERQLVRRFGPLPKKVRNKLTKAELAQLEAWSDALPEAESLSQVFR
ncbi:DUF4351 domain-containing protein [Duganella sp. P38]|uniref:DUF4351 domain-containing protein n=1 Tax=Duganella sp. P38 TaxID=3423949 RepID=UPI003D798618